MRTCPGHGMIKANERGDHHANLDRPHRQRQNNRNLTGDRRFVRAGRGAADPACARAELTPDGAPPCRRNRQPRRAHGRGADVFSPGRPRVLRGGRAGAADAHPGRAAFDLTGGRAPRAGRPFGLERPCGQAGAAPRSAAAGGRVQDLRGRAGSAVCRRRGM